MNDYCYYYTKLNKRCTIFAKDIYKLNDYYYCKKHFNIMQKRNNNIMKIKCNYKTKTNNECSINAKDIYKIDNYYYCKKHFDILQKKSIKSSKIETNNEVIKKDEKQKEIILNEINKLKLSNINSKNKSQIKKDIYKVLLQIHPDKCTNPLINSHELTQELTQLLNNIKLY
jgi:hypothetical protein